MTSDSLLTAATQAVLGKTIWRAWRGAGSHVFFELGEPKTWVSKIVRPRPVNGVVVERRRAGVWGSHSVGIEMAEWKLFFGASLIADSEATDETFIEVLNWLEGQHLVELTKKAQTVVSLEFDLKARFELTSPLDLEGDSDLLSIRCAEQVTIIRADGSVVTELWSAKQVHAPRGDQAG